MCVSQVLVNPQTALLCSMLDLTDPNAVHLGISNHHTLAKLMDINAEMIDIGDDSVDSDDGDEMPSDINSSLDTSCLSGNLDTSDSFSITRRKNFVSRLSAGTRTPPVQVDDDDEEFQAILAAQRQNSQQIDAVSEPSEKPMTEKSTPSSDSDTKSSIPCSPKTEGSEEEFAAIMAAQEQSNKKLPSKSENVQKLVGDVAGFQEKSSSDLDSASQDSQEEAGRAESLSDESPKSSTGSAEVSRGRQSLQVGNGFGSPATKRQSPDAEISSPSSTGKKLKRRNVSMYSSSGTEEDIC